MDLPSSDGVFLTNNDEKNEILRLTKLLEESKQEAYELKSRLRIAERCAGDYESELEVLQQDALAKDNLHAAAIREMQEERCIALKDAQEKIENWEIEFQKISDKAASLEKELVAKSMNTDIVSKERNETTALHHELEEALDALSASTAACRQHKELASVLQKEKQELAHRVELLESNLELYKEYLAVSKAQLSAQTEEFKELQEQFTVTQSELSALKAAPDVQARGNSLFAEVEDKRQQMVKQYKSMLVKFNHMKNNYSTKCSEITKLKKEKSMLLDKLEIAEKEARKHYKGFVENYEIRINELQMTISDMKNDVNPVYLNGNDSILKFAEQTVMNSREEVLKLRKEMEVRSALRLSEAAELIKTQGELAKARSDLRKSTLMVEELKSVLHERGIAHVPTTPELASSEEEPPKLKSSANGFRSVALQNPREIVFEEELLHDKFNPKLRSADKAIIPEDLVSKQIKKMEESIAAVKSLEEKPQKLKSFAAEQESPKSKSSTTGFRSVALQNTKEIAFKEEFLHKSNHELRSEDEVIIPEDLVSEQIKRMEESGVAVKSLEEELTNKTETTVDCGSGDEGVLLNDVDLNESVSRANLADELGLEKSLETGSNYLAVAFEASALDEDLGGLPVSDELLKDDEVLIPSGESPGGSPRFDDRVFLSASVGSPTSSDYFDMTANGGFNSSPRLSNATSCVTAPTQSSSSNSSDIVTEDMLVLKLDLTPEMDETSLRSNSTKCEEKSRPVLKVRPIYSAFENDVKNVKKEVRFDKESEKVESDKEIFQGTSISETQVEMYKAAGFSENEVENTKPARRRPRPKQNYPIFYIS